MNSYENELIKFDTVKIRTKEEYLINRNIQFNKNYNTDGDLTGIYIIILKMINQYPMIYI